LIFKIREVRFVSSSGKDNLKFEYDAMGNRVAKYVMDEQTSFAKHVTYYVRDASGNVMAVYEHDLETPESYHLAERHIYGSSRLGMITEKVEFEYVYGNQPTEDLVSTLAIEETVNFELEYSVGKKQYELSNHLGNVLTVISDWKVPVISGASVVSYSTVVVSSQDYSPFGVTLSGRSWSEGYRYGLMGYEMDNELKGDGNSYDMGARLYDPRTGRTPSVDPAATLFPSDSPYIFAGNNPIFYVDEEGKWKVRFRDNNDHTAGIVLEAEPGDNLQTLATQMGIPYQQLVDENFGGKDFTLNAPLEGGEWLRQEDLPGVEAFQTTNNFLKGVTNENCNCANLALGANGISSIPFNEDSGFESVPQASELAREGQSVSIGDAKFGDMITYKMTFENYIGYALSNGIQDYYKNPDGSLMTTEEIMPYIEAEYAKQKDMDHFSIFLLKDKTGTAIQQVLEKNGDLPVQISSGSGGAGGQYTPASAKGDGGSSINRINQ